MLKPCINRRRFFLISRTVCLSLIYATHEGMRTLRIVRYSNSKKIKRTILSASLGSIYCGRKEFWESHSQKKDELWITESPSRLCFEKGILLL